MPMIPAPLRFFEVAVELAQLGQARPGIAPKGFDAIDVPAAPVMPETVEDQPGVGLPAEQIFLAGIRIAHPVAHVLDENGVVRLVVQDRLFTDSRLGDTAGVIQPAARRYHSTE